MLVPRQLLVLKNGEQQTQLTVKHCDQQGQPGRSPPYSNSWGTSNSNWCAAGLGLFCL